MSVQHGAWAPKIKVKCTGKQEPFGGKNRPKTADMTQRESGPDQRRWTRHKIDVRLKVFFNNEGKDVSVFGRANLLSQGGLGAYIPASILLGETVTVEVSFPYSPAEVKLRAIVRNCEGFRYGLEFIDLSEEVRDVIVKNCKAAALLQ